MKKAVLASGGDGANLLVASDIVAGYGSRTVLDGVSLSCGRGAFVAVAGANGAGKTTMLKCLSGLLKPRSGTVSIFGQDVFSLGDRERARRIAYVPQRVNEDWTYPVEEYVRLGRYASSGALAPLGESDRDACHRAFELTDTLHFRSRTLGELSGGEAARVRAARAIAQQADVIAFDEPLANLDPGRQVEFMGLLASLSREGILVLASLHDFNAAMRYADSAILVKTDGTALTGMPGDVFRSSEMEEEFRTPFARGEHSEYGMYVFPVHGNNIR